MDIVSLNDDNVWMYEDYLTPDVAENIGRTFYRGIVVEDEGAPVAGMVWEVRNTMEDADNESFISFLRIDSEEVSDMLFEKYSALSADDEVQKTGFAIPAKATEKERAALSRAGFSVKFMEGDLIRATISEIAELKYFKKVTTLDNIHELKTMTQRSYNAAIRTFIDKGMHGICEDLPYLPMQYFENEMSCYSETDGEVDGIFFFHRRPSGGLIVVVLAALGKDYGRILPQLIKYAVTNALESYPGDTEILIDRHNYASLALSEKLFPNDIGTPVYIGSRKET